MKNHTNTSHDPVTTGRRNQTVHTADRKRGVKYESDRLITKHVQENGISPRRKLPAIPMKVLNTAENKQTMTAGASL